MPKGQGFPAANKIMKRHEEQRAFKLHRQKVQEMRAGLDNSEPRRFPHLILRLKQTQMEEEYLANVDHENKLLLHKMMRIMEKPRSKGLDNWNDYEAKSLNLPKRARAHHRIQRENLAIARRIESVRPMYSTDKWEEDHKRHKYLLDLWADESTPRKGKKHDAGDSKKGDDDQYDDDFESDEEEKDKEGDKKDDEDRKGERLPEIKQDKERGKHKDKDQHSRRSKSETSLHKLPPVHNKRKQDPKLYMYYGKFFYGSDNEEDEKSSLAERDARELFRVAKTLAPPTDILIRTLVRRSPKQREMTKKKFYELYELDLATELKNGLSKDWHMLIDALLPESSDEDGDKDKDKDKDGSAQDDGPEDALRSALKSGDISTAVNIIAGKNDKQLADLKENYKKEHGISLESEVEERTEDPVRLFLLTLVKERREGKKEGVQQDATAIHEQGDGRWSSPNGEFIKLLETRNNGHMRAVLKKYQQVSGTSAVKAVEQECSKDYAEAVTAFMNSKGSGKGGGGGGGGDGGGSSGEATAHAIVMHKNLNPENATFVNLLVERAEIDMPTVRKAYKDKYKSEMHTDLGERSRHVTVPCLKELILKKPSQGKGKDQGDQGQKGQEQKKGGQDKKEEDGKKKKKAGADPKADEDAEKLYNAMKGLGTDEDTILDIIIKRSNAQRQTLKKKYKEKYNKELADDLKSELSGDFEEVILGLLMPPVEYDAFCVNKAVKGLGTNEDVLIGILCTANPKELSSVKERYKKSYGEDLDSAIKGDTSGGFADLLLGLSKGERDQGTSVSEKEAKEDAQKLFKDKKKKLDMKDETFKQLMIKKNKEQAKATFAEYKKLSGKSMEQAIKDASSGDEEDGYVALLGAMDDPVTFYADSLQKAFKGMGTNDDQLIRIVISRSEVDLPAIKAKFQKRHGRSLRDAIESETSGDYRKALIKIVDKKQPSEEAGDGKQQARSKPNQGGQASNGKTTNADSRGGSKPKQSPLTKNESATKSSDKKDGNKKSDGVKDKETKKDKGKSKDKEEDDADPKADEDAEKLYNAMKGLGTDEDTILDIIIKRSNAQRQTLKKKYKEKYNKELADDLESELGGDFEEVILGLLMPPVEYDAFCVNKAVKGLGTNEDVLIGILGTANPKDLTSVKEHYKKSYGEDLDVAIEKDTSGGLNTSGGFSDLLLAVSQGDRDPGTAVSEKEAREDAEKLCTDKKKKLDLRDETFKQLVTKKNKEQMKATFAEYKKLSGKTMEEAIAEAATRDERDAYLQLFGAMDDPVTFYADSLQKAFKGMGTNDDLLIRIVISRSEVDLPAIKAKFQERHGRSLRDAIKSETSGDYRKALIRIVDKNGGQASNSKTTNTNSKGASKPKQSSTTKNEPATKSSDKKNGTKKSEGGKDKETKKDKGKSKDKQDDDEAADANAGEDAEKLYNAMKGLGTDEDTILDIIIKRSNAQRQTLKKKYKEKYNKELADDLESELGGDFEEVILGLLMPPVEYDAFCVNKAVKGLGTNEDVLIGILGTANPKELTLVKEHYKKSYGEDLDVAIEKDTSGGLNTSGGFSDLLLAVSQGDRDPGSAVSEKEAREDAEKLCTDKKKKLDLRSETFKQLVTKKNKEQVKATFAEYKKLSGKTMEDAIAEAATRDDKDAYLELIGAMDDPVTFYADSLQKAFKGMGTNDDLLIRIVISRSEVDLPAIKAKFQERHGRSLRDAIKSETSGDYRKALIRIVDKK
ncbi:uncharacterized protein LOC143296253 [Babylonia areolata]|uniref:uncharacterized protein LOC143296253 n=1 Tax=Babylonia areolata TaxID=304850 RepID=UPI003FD39253